MKHAITRCFFVHLLLYHRLSGCFFHGLRFRDSGRNGTIISLENRVGCLVKRITLNRRCYRGFNSGLTLTELWIFEWCASLDFELVGLNFFFGAALPKFGQHEILRWLKVTEACLNEELVGCDVVFWSGHDCDLNLLRFLRIDDTLEGLDLVVFGRSRLDFVSEVVTGRLIRDGEVSNILDGSSIFAVLKTDCGWRVE